MKKTFIVLSIFFNSFAHTSTASDCILDQKEEKSGAEPRFINERKTDPVEMSTKRSNEKASDPEDKDLTKPYVEAYIDEDNNLIVDSTVIDYLEKKIAGIEDETDNGKNILVVSDDVFEKIHKQIYGIKPPGPQPHHMKNT